MKHHLSPARQLTRRAVLKTGAAAAATLLLGRTLRAQSSSTQLRLAFVGVGGRGRSAVRSETEQHYVAFADVDDAEAAESYSAFPKVPRYRDYRKMLDRHASEMDAVVIATPDHSHFPIAMACMTAGKHVYIEKPLATTPWECRELARAAATYKVKAQLGVQGHSFEALRVLREWIDAGVAGAIHTVYLWTNRMNPARYSFFESLPPEEAVPATLDWGLWLADRPHRAFSPQYVPDRWRNWWTFGTGPLGDIGVHMFDALEFALELGFPEVIEPEVPVLGEVTSPPWSRLRWSFPRRGARGPIVVQWFNGSRDGKLFRPADIPRLPREIIEKTTNGIALVGTEGTLFVPDMRISSRPRVYPLERERDVLEAPPARRLPRLKSTHMGDWLSSIVENRSPGAPLDYGAALTEMVLIGTFAQRSGKAIRWNRTTMSADGVPEVSAWVQPPQKT